MKGARTSNSVRVVSTTKQRITKSDYWGTVSPYERRHNSAIARADQLIMLVGVTVRDLQLFDPALYGFELVGT